MKTTFNVFSFFFFLKENYVNKEKYLLFLQVQSYFFIWRKGNEINSKEKRKKIELFNQNTILIVIIIIFSSFLRNIFYEYKYIYIYRKIHKFA